MRLLALLLLTAGFIFAADDRITAPIDANQRLPLAGQVHPAIRTAADLGTLAPDAMIHYAAILFQPGPGLNELLAEQQNPSSANFHKWLTPEQFGEQFGLSSGDTVKVASWLRSQGLTVHDVARGRHWITFSGTSAAMSSAFHTQFHRFQTGGETHFSATTDPEVPAAIAGVVSGIAGLDDFDLKPASVRAATQPADNIGTAHYLAPADVATIYDMNPLYQAGIDGTGVTIAIVGVSDVNLSDVRAFRKKFNLPAKDPKLVVVGPDPGSTNLSALDEANLDIQWSGAVAPNADIVYIAARSVTTAALYAVDQNVGQILSESFGGCEVAAQAGLRATAQQANAQGITWVVASGDWGAATCDVNSASILVSKGYSASFPSTLPEVTAVGGTQFNEGTGNYWAAANDANGGSALSYIPETTWNEAATLHLPLATGGGASALFSKPVWQTGPGVPNDSARDVPDIAMNAAVSHDSVLVITANNLIAVGGTSVATPIFAGVTALLNHYLMTKSVIAAPGLGNLNPSIYRLAQATTDVFHDITTGDNKVPCVQESAGCVNGLIGMAATPSWDMVTGWGSMDVNHLISEWTTGTASATKISANPTHYSLGDKIQLTATVSGSGSVAPTGVVTFISNDLVIGSGTISNGSVAVTADSLLFAGGSGWITAEYGGDGVYNASGASTSVTLNLPASGSLVIPTVTPNPVTQSGANWPYTLRLDEKAGVATKLTTFTVNGVNNLSAFSSTTIPAHGSLSASLAGNNLTVPLDRTYHFAGVDGNGRTWTQDLTVPFRGPAGGTFVPKITLTAVPSITENNPAADRTCGFSQQLILEETTGFFSLIEQLVANNTDISDQILAIFGTDRIGPYSTLRGTVCWPQGTAPGSKNYQLQAGSEINSSLVGAANTTLSAAAAHPATASVTPRVVEMLSDAASRSGVGTINVNFTGGSPQWTASVFPARAAKWLNIAPLSGTGNGQINLQASGTALSNGVYDATIVVQASGAVPQTTSIRVVFAVGWNSSTVIDSVANAAFPNPTAAPGTMLKISGSNLASVKSAATVVEGNLPFSIGGISATVNGTGAPVYSISPGEVVIQVPYETSAGPAVLGLNQNGHVTPFVFDVAAAAPQIFQTANGFASGTSSIRQGQPAAIYITGDGVVAPFLTTGNAPPAGTSPANLPGPEFGLSVTVGGVRAPISFYGIPVGLVGVTQVNFTVPATVAAGVQPVVVTVGGVPSAPASITVTAAGATGGK